jgi:hypothetical protein
VIAAGFEEAQRRDPHHQRTWVVLVDGNRTQIEAITAEAARRQVSVRIACDLHPRARIPLESRPELLRDRRRRRRELGR